MTRIKIQCKHYDGNMAKCTHKDQKKRLFGLMTKRCPLIFDEGPCELREASKRPLAPPPPMRTAVNS